MANTASVSNSADRPPIARRVYSDPMASILLSRARGVTEIDAITDMMAARGMVRPRDAHGLFEPRKPAAR
jgi:hypothetical protein